MIRKPRRVDRIRQQTAGNERRRIPALDLDQPGQTLHTRNSQERFLMGTRCRWACERILRKHIALLVAGWALPFLLIAAAASSGNLTIDDGQGSPGMGAATALVAFLIYFVFVGFGSVFTGVWGWLGLRGGVEGRSGARHRHARAAIARPVTLAPRRPAVL